MSKAMQDQDLLAIFPQNELKFDGPFNSPVTSWIKLTNKTEKTVHFKLKTTAPKRYCVRPNSGFLTPKGSVEVQVLLQPFAFNPAEKNKHKFMIQSVLMPEGYSTAQDDLWKVIDQDKIINYKLKCVFDLPASAATQGTEQEQNIEPVNQTTLPKVPLPGLGGELQKAASEVIQLREEESKLRQENIALKEEIARLRCEETMRHSYSPPPVQQSPFVQGSVPTFFIVISIAIAFFALLLGKFAL